MTESTELLESSLSWSEFWATMACGAVALGLVIEYRSELKKTIAERNLKLLPIGALLVTLGVMLEFGFQIRTSLLVAEVRSIQQQHVAATNERAAKAEKEAAEAKLALARMSAPRKLTPDGMEALIGRLRHQAGKSFWVMTQRSPTSRFGEQTDFAKQLSGLSPWPAGKGIRISAEKTVKMRCRNSPLPATEDAWWKARSPSWSQFVRDQLTAVEVNCDSVENPEYEQDFVLSRLA